MNILRRMMVITGKAIKLVVLLLLIRCFGSYLAGQFIDSARGLRLSIAHAGDFIRRCCLGE
jgi:hypothetical protein